MSETTTPARILIADAISEEGIRLLRETPGFEVEVRTGMTPDEVRTSLADFDGLVVRSATKVTADVLPGPTRLKVIGRAGTGVDNIDLDAATRAGVVVMNTPGGNSVAAAELTLAHLLSLARNVSPAHRELREGEWQRKKYMGVEIAGKTLGVIGLGRIGREVARGAAGLRMQVVGYDPFVSSTMAEGMGLRVVDLDTLLAESDFVSIHVPKTDETRHLIDGAAIAKMKPGARLINCARGGLVDEAALLAALEEGRLAGAALDVYEEEPPTDLGLVRHDAVVATPHLGASTREAQIRVGTEIAEKIRDYIRDGLILDAVNFPSFGREASAVMGPRMALAERLGSFVSQIAEGGFKRLEVRALGSFADDALKPIVMAATKGLLEPIVSGAVSYVNAPSLASERGIVVEESRSTEASSYAGLVRLNLETDGGTLTVAGTLVGDGQPRLVEVDGVRIQSVPEGHLLFIRNRDVPGVVGKIGTVLGSSGINIADIHLGRGDAENAVSIVRSDAPVPEAALQALRGSEEIVLARAIEV